MKINREKKIFGIKNITNISKLDIIFIIGKL
jgi:hypothetical protein